PKILVPMWKDLLTQMDVPYILICTYDKLAGKKKSGCKHPYLTRQNNDYSVTQGWLNIGKKPGSFIICDESQAIKNETSARHWAFFTLISSISKNMKNNCKVLHLTASPIDKKDNWSCL